MKQKIEQKEWPPYYEIVVHFSKAGIKYTKLKKKNYGRVLISRAERAMLLAEQNMST